MKSLSLEMLRMANSFANACSCSDDWSCAPNPEVQSPREERLEQDDSIPAKTQRHLASFLAAHSNQEVAAEDLLPLLSNSPYINQKQKILNRTILEPGPLKGHDSAFAATMATQFERRLQELPAEVLCMIEDYLDPSDLVCLGRTCRALFQAVDYQMVDLRNVSFAEDLWPVLSEHDMDYALAKERYSIVRRLHRDRLEHLERQATGTDSMACSSCVRPHPPRYFTPAEQKKPVQARRCLASTAPIRICSHWTEDQQSLRQRRTDANCEPRSLAVLRTDRCVHVDHELKGFSAPCMRDLGSTFIVEQQITPLQTEDRDAVDENAVKDVLTSPAFRDIRVCPHIRLGDQAIMSSFRRRPLAGEDDSRHVADLIIAAVGQLLGFESSSCKGCGRDWQFSIFDNLAHRQSPQYTLRLIVDDQIKAVKDPWTKEYLRKVEGGSKLMKLMNL